MNEADMYTSNGQMIKATIILDSLFMGKRIVTFELEYPRYIHSELMTHRVFSRNASSSRAIPIERMIELVKTQPIKPHWTQNQAGMQGDAVSNAKQQGIADHIWGKARMAAIEFAKELSEAGIHKQNANRLLEPFQSMKTLVTATEWDNFFDLRCHPDAQPEIQELANLMRMEMRVSKPMELKQGEWHIPYVFHQRVNGELQFSDDEGVLSLEDAKAISASCCAQVSYRRLDTSRAKALDIFKRLVASRPIHASPFEHQAQAEPGVHRNFVNWSQYRCEIEGAH